MIDRVRDARSNLKGIDKKNIAQKTVTQSLPYGVTLLAVGLALGITLVSGSILLATPLQLFFLAVMISAWYGGWRQGLLATALSVFAVKYFLIEPYYSLSITDFGSVVRLGTFVLASVIIMWLNQLRQIAQRKAELTLQTLRESESRFGRLADSNIIGIIVSDLNGLILEANDAFLRIVGYSQADLRSGRLRWHEITSPEYQQISEQSLQDLRTTGVFTPFEQEYIHKDGSHVPILVSFLMSEGDTSISSVVDLSERRQAETAQVEATLREQALRTEAQIARDHLENVLASINDQFVVLDPQWRYTYVNDRFVEVVGRPKTDFLGNCIWELFPNMIGTSFYTEVYRAVAAQTQVHQEFFYDSWQRWFETHIYPSAQGVAILATDITERKRIEDDRRRAEAELRESEARFRHMADTSPVLIWISGTDKLCYYFNQPWLDFTGRTMEQEMGNGWAEEIHADDRQRCLKAYFTAFDARQPFQMEYRFRRYDGLYRWMVNAAVPRFTSEGDFLGYIGSCIDIEDRKQTETALRESKARLDFLLEAARFGDWDLDLENHSAYRSFRHDQIFGYESLLPEWTYEMFLAHVVPEERENVDRQHRRAISNSEPWDFECRICRVDKQVRWIWASGYLYQNAEGEGTRMLGLVADITDRKQIEAELRQKNAILDTINKSAPTPIFVKDRQGRIIYANPATLEVLGKSSAEVIGYCDSDLYPNRQDATTVMDNDRRIMESGQTEVVEESPDGIRTFLSMKSPYCNEVGEVIGLIGIANDISDRVQLERDRERILQQEQVARKASEDANRIKDEFLAVLSHELRTPLNPILGWAKLLRSKKLDEATVNRALETIERNAQIQTQLIEDLLDVSRILQGKLNLSVSPVDLDFIIRAAIETAQLAAEAKFIQIRTAIAPNVGQVLGDPSRLQQVVWNILSNAVKFTPTGGRVEIRLEKYNNHAQVIISDTGKGIALEFLPYVFDYFRQADSATTRKFGGLGLGLAIVRQIVDLHGGTVFVESLGEGQGATFTVRLPFTPKLKQKKDNTSRSISGFTGASLTGLRILVVDDESDSRDFVAFILEQQGADVIAFSSASEAMQELMRHQPDILLSDIGMPEMDGYALLQQVRNLSPAQGGTVPAIALTAYVSEVDQQQALAAGFQTHLSKPIDPEQLIRAIAQVLEIN